jgi:hypothetical protein
MKVVMTNSSVMGKMKSQSMSLKILIASSGKKLLYSKITIGKIWQMFSVERFRLVKK